MTNITASTSNVATEVDTTAGRPSSKMGDFFIKV